MGSFSVYVFVEGGHTGSVGLQYKARLLTTKSCKSYSAVNWPNLMLLRKESETERERLWFVFVERISEVYMRVSSYLGCLGRQQ